MRLGIDLDDTVTLTYEYIMPLVKEYIENDLGREYEYIDSEIEWYRLTNHCGLTDEEQEFCSKNYYGKGVEYYSPLKDSIDIINKLFDKKNEIIFITSRNNEHCTNKEELTIKWLEKNNVKYNNVIFDVKNKGDIAEKENIDIFIDDSIRHCKGVASKGIKTYLMTRPFNKNYECKEFERVESWEDFYKKIKDKN